MGLEDAEPLTLLAVTTTLYSVATVKPVNVAVLPPTDNDVGVTATPFKVKV